MLRRPPTYPVVLRQHSWPAAFMAAGLFRYNFKPDVATSKDSHALTRTFLAAQVGLALLIGALSASCSKTPIAPTPPVVAAPVISCPASQSLTSPLATPIPVVYSSPSVVGGASPITTSCTPASGSTFPLGTTTVTCTATDAQQRVSSCSLTVAVAAPPQIRLTKFVAFGDSLTKGEDGQNALTLEVAGRLTFLRSILLSGFEYPTVLTQDLQARYSLQAASIAVANLGCAGETVSDTGTLNCGQLAVQRFTSVIQGQQVVLLMEGSNDVNLGLKDSVVMDNALINLRTMIRAAKAAGVVPYLATIPPMNPPTSPNSCTPSCRGVGASLVPGFNDRIRLLASSEGVTPVDVYSAFNGDLTLLSTDGLHPNASGYARIADTFFQAIKGTLEVAPTLSGASGQIPGPRVGR